MTNAAALWIKNTEAQKKVARNAHKLAWMDATRRMGAEVIFFEPQLAAYEAEAKKAAAEFAKAVEGMTTEQVVAIITGAGA